MLWYWDTVIKPLLDAAAPEVVVEVGSWKGETTEKLLAWAAPRRARVHAIDPSPQFDLAALQEEYPETLVFHRELSLDALRAIDKPGAALLDGDHNWYTVINELRLLAESSQARRYPLTLLHDIAWPYGRRDLYYDPATVPEAHRNAYDKAGLLPGQPEPKKKKGLNPHLDNAIRDGGPENGVLTAVEDFLEETDRKLKFHAIPGIHGLGILVPSARARAKGPLRNEIERLSSPEFLELHSKRIEAERIREKVEALDFQRLAAQTKRALAAHRSEHDELKARLSKRNRGIEVLRSESRMLEQRLAKREAEVRSLHSEREEHAQLLAGHDLKLQKARAQLSRLTSQREEQARESAERARELSELRSERDELVAESAARAARSGELEERIAEADAALERLRSDRQALSQQVELLTSRAESASRVSRKLWHDLDQHRHERERLIEESRALAAQLDEREREHAALEAERERLMEESSALADRVAELESAGASAADDLEALSGLREEHRAALKALGQSRETLALVVTEAERAAEEIERASRSRAWRFGHRSMKLLSRLALRHPQGTHSLERASERMRVLRHLTGPGGALEAGSFGEAGSGSRLSDVAPELPRGAPQAGDDAASELARLEAEADPSPPAGERRLVNIPELEVSDPELATRVTQARQRARVDGGTEQAAASAEIADAVIKAFRSRLHRRWIDEAHDANLRHADSVRNRGPGNGSTPVMVGTLDSGERELELSRQSVAAQDHAAIEHVVISDMPKKEAVATLMERFISSDCEFLLKLDADMVLLDPRFVARALRLLEGNPDLDLAQIAILDYFTGGPMQGLNVYRQGLDWQSARQDDLFTDRTLVEVAKRTVVSGPLMRAAIHSPDPSPFQAFHFGVHRGLKISQPERGEFDESQAMEQLSYLERTWDHFKIRRDVRLALACLGCELALDGEFGVSDVDYTNPSMRQSFASFEDLDAAGLEELVESHRRSPVSAPRTERLRGSRRQIHWQSAAAVRSVLILLPHFGVFGGVNRQFELAQHLARQGVEAVVTQPERTSAGLPTERPDYAEVTAIPFREALERSWDVVLCADCTGGVLLTMPLFASRRNAVYLFNGWMYRTANVEQIRAIQPDVVLANSTYSARYYEDLAPVVVPGAIDLDVFYPSTNGHGSRDEVVRIVAYPGRHRPMKRFEDTLEACRLLHAEGIPIELNVYDQDGFEPDVPFAFRHHGALSREELRGLLWEMDVMISAEEDAGWSNPTAEAMACGVPVICTEAGTTDLAIDERTALVVPPRSPARIAAAARRLVDEPALASLLREQALAGIRDYDWPKVAGRLLDAFAEVPAHPWRRAAVNRRAVQRISAL